MMFHVEQPNSRHEQFLQHFNVPRETLERLEAYERLLVEWNQKFNLVSESTLPEVWTRHFLDSAQIMAHVPHGTITVADLGSGAGFPGLVLNILGIEDVHLIESIGKKASFLREVIQQLKLTATVHQKRIEDMKGFKADLITARALKALPELLALATPLIKRGSTAIFLKGQSVEDELTEARKSWTFKAEKHQSITSDSGCVLILQDIAKRHDTIRKTKSQSA
jgi:16S rRNA (guanine527-N7)-methyltransferase